MTRFPIKRKRTVQKCNEKRMPPHGLKNSDWHSITVLLNSIGKLSYPMVSAPPRCKLSQMHLDTKAVKKEKNHCLLLHHTTVIITT